MKRLKIVSYLSSLSLLVAAKASAQGLVAPAKPSNLPGGASDTATDILVKIINLGLGVVGIIAVGFIILGGFRYITSAGNEEAAESGKKMITNAIIGLVIIILSYTIITVIINAFAKERVL
jgi:hypothetical protein